MVPFFHSQCSVIAVMNRIVAYSLCLLKLIVCKRGCCACVIIIILWRPAGKNL